MPSFDLYITEIVLVSQELREGPGEGQTDAPHLTGPEDRCYSTSTSVRRLSDSAAKTGDMFNKDFMPRYFAWNTLA